MSGTTTLSARSPLPLPLNQIAFSVVDLRRTEGWWCDGLGFLPAGGSRLMMRGPLSTSIVDLPGTRVDWPIRFRSRIPGLGVPLRYLLEHKPNAALAGLRRQLTS